MFMLSEKLIEKVEEESRPLFTMAQEGIAILEAGKSSDETKVAIDELYKINQYWSSLIMVLCKYDKMVDENGDLVIEVTGFHDGDSLIALLIPMLLEFGCTGLHENRKAKIDATTCWLAEFNVLCFHLFEKYHIQIGVHASIFRRNVRGIAQGMELYCDAIGSDGVVFADLGERMDYLWYTLGMQMDGMAEKLGQGAGSIDRSGFPLIAKEFEYWEFESEKPHGVERASDFFGCLQCVQMGKYKIEAKELVFQTIEAIADTLGVKIPDRARLEEKALEAFNAYVLENTEKFKHGVPVPGEGFSFNPKLID